MSAFDDFIRAIEQATGRPGKRHGREVRLLCPAHDDHDPSLDVTEGDDGRPLVQCRSHGCTFDAICAAMGSTQSDFQPDGTTPSEDGFLAVYDYVDANGVLLFQVCRRPGKQFPQRRPDGSGGWIWKLGNTRRVIYRLPHVIEAVAQGRRIWLVEGEKDVQAVERLGEVATTNPGGAGKWRQEYASPLQGAAVTIVADSDDTGRAHARQACASLAKVAASVDVVEAREGKDASDHIAAGHDLDSFVPLRAEQPSRDDLTDLTVDEILAANPDLSKEELLEQNPFLRALLAGRDSQATALVKLAVDSGALLLHDEEPRAYISFEAAEGCLQTWPLRSRAVKLWLRRLFHEKNESALSAQAVTDALATLEADAIFKGPRVDVHLRLAADAGAIVIDLGDERWRSVRITAEGWRILDEHPVRFRRARGLTELPEPAPGGNLDLLRPFLNLATDADWILVVAWLVGALRPPGYPYPVLCLHGEQGAAKSFAARILRALIDPSTVPLRAAPHNGRDLMISATAGWVIAFDNLSHLQPWLSDALCRLSTGGGFSTRELYSDDDEILFDAQRPVVVNGIEELATRSDLLDRSLILHLPTIAREQRRPESELWSEFLTARPLILGALYDVVAGALGLIAKTHLERLPRMADFALWVVAAEPSLGWEDGTFLDAYEQNRGQANELAVDASIVGPPLLIVADNGFEGTATELLDRLEVVAAEKLTKAKEWPNSPRALSGIVKRLAPNLRGLGFEVVLGYRETGTGRRLIRIQKRES